MADEQTANEAMQYEGPAKVDENTEYAGKNKSFPITVPMDVQHAAQAIGRAGNDNYSTDELKSRIIAIAKRKGPGFVAMLPDAWKQNEAQDADLAGDFMALEEKAVREDGVVRVKLIQPGWGSSGYYGAQMLERDGPKVFKSGTHMYWDHPGQGDRPERSLRDLAAVLVSDARWDANGRSGAGLYAEAKVFGPFQQAVEQMAPHIGVSIRALGKATPGEVEGKRGSVIESIQAAQSVDFVTAPGAGGKILNLFESARERTTQTHPQEGTVVNEKELEEARTALAERDKELTEAKAKLATQETELARFREAALVNDAKRHATDKIAKANLPDVTKVRIVESVSANPPAKDGALDEKAFDERLAEAVKAEAEYLSKVTGGGMIRGMGGSGSASSDDAEKRLTEAFKDLGFSDEQTKIAVAGRNN